MSVLNRDIYPTELTAIMPLLEQGDLGKLNGEKGTNREVADHCQINASNDYDALYVWLNEYQDSPRTYQAYRREAERLLLWCVIQQNKALSSLQRDDVDMYKTFLMEPQPRGFWCSDSARQMKRGEPGWKPFKTGLGAASLKTAMNIIYSMFQYLVDAEYLRRNPMTLMRKRVRESETLEVKALKRQTMILSPRQWGLINETVVLWPEDNYSEQRKKQRVTLILAMQYYLMLRVSDLANATWLSFKVSQDKWWFHVIGKGNKEALLPVPDKLLEVIKAYRTFFGMSAYPSDEEQSVLISWRSGEGIGARQINHILKTLALETLERISPLHDDAEKLTAFSSHKVRHVAGADLVRAKLPADMRRQLMRHSKLETTLEYSHLSDNELHQAINQLGKGRLK